MVFPSQRTGHVDLEISGDLRIHGLSDQNMHVHTHTCTHVDTHVHMHSCTCTQAHIHKTTTTETSVSILWNKVFFTQTGQNILYFIFKNSEDTSASDTSTGYIHTYIYTYIHVLYNDITTNDITNLHITCMLIIYSSIPSVLKCFSNS